MRESTFDHSGSPVMLVQACLSAKKDQETFDHDGSHMTLVQPCLCACKDRRRFFHYCGGAVKCVLTCFSAVMVVESSF